MRPRNGEVKEKVFTLTGSCRFSGAGLDKRVDSFNRQPGTGNNRRQHRTNRRVGLLIGVQGNPTNAQRVGYFRSQVQLFKPGLELVNGPIHHGVKDSGSVRGAHGHSLGVSLDCDGPLVRLPVQGVKKKSEGNVKRIRVRESNPGSLAR